MNDQVDMTGEADRALLPTLSSEKEAVASATHIYFWEGRIVTQDDEGPL